MAEERLIDDDLNKDKKYKIRKNADGEDELYIDDSVQEEDEELEAVSFEAPVFADSEEYLTPEQRAAIEQEQQERAERIRGALSVNIEKAEAKIAEENFEGALGDTDAALLIDAYSGTAWALRLKALTKNFTAFERLDDCVEAAENISQYCTVSEKTALSELSSPLESKIEELEEQAAAQHVEVEDKKAERRVVFAEERKKSIVWFSVTLVPFLACLIVALAFGSVMFARHDGLNVILTIVFAALAAVFFLASLFTGHKMWAAMKKVSLNEKNSSTKLGREYEETLAEIKKLKTVLNSFKI